MTRLSKRENEIRQSMLSGDETIVNAVEKAYIRFAEDDKLFNDNKSKLFLSIYYRYKNESVIVLSRELSFTERTIYRRRSEFIIWIDFYTIKSNIGFKVPKVVRI